MLANSTECFLPVSQLCNIVVRFALGTNIEDNNKNWN
jgi:hypothetical protein